MMQMMLEVWLGAGLAAMLVVMAYILKRMSTDKLEVIHSMSKNQRKASLDIHIHREERGTTGPARKEAERREERGGMRKRGG